VLSGVFVIGTSSEFCIPFEYGIRDNRGADRDDFDIRGIHMALSGYGVEAWRTNMPTGGISFKTLAASTVDGANESAWFSTTLASSALVSGTNVIAVEIHQDGATSSDISFDLKLTAQ
jgi:hypothetical protein